MPDPAVHRHVRSPAPAPVPPDSELRGLVALLPRRARPFALLARFDRPIGWWLLFWPCAAGVALAGGVPERWALFPLLLIGAVAMRGAGCVYNDIIDRDLDAQVSRTAARPIPSGAVSVRAAWAWLALLCLIGLGVLLALDSTIAQVVALGSLALVAAYPFMKRITWWPQAWLGLVFSWGALVGWLAVRHSHALPDPAMLWLYAGCVAWVIGYDTIYALQDVEDDALVGIRSSARALGGRVRMGIAALYLAAVAGWALALWHVRPDPLALAALAPAAAHLGWQVMALSPDDAHDPLAKFRSNRTSGALLFLATLVVGSSA